MALKSPPNPKCKPLMSERIMSIKRPAIRLVLFVITVIAVSSCKIATPPPPLPPAPAMPETYIGGTATLTDGTIQWRDFFSDTVLVGLIETALANNYDLLTAIQRVEMARANYRIRSGALFPSVNAAA